MTTLPNPGPGAPPSSDPTIARTQPAFLTIDCQSCGSVLQVVESERTANCPYCASSSVVERPPTPDRPAPDYAIGFVLDEATAQARARAWLKEHRWFSPGALRRALPERTRAVYLPAYLYGATAHSTYQADIGEHYTVVERYTTTDSKGRVQTHTRTRTETEWRPLTGRHACFVLDHLVTASRGIPNAELEEIEPYDLRALRRYDPGIIAGWTCEEPSHSPAEGRQLARAEANQALAQRLASFMPGDTHRALRHDTLLSDEDLDLVLLPLWVFAARWHANRPPARVVVNGQTGEVVGHAPVSAARVVVIVLAVLLATAGVVGLAMFFAKAGS